ncbi:hypothetical protein PAECIP111893_03518 [Paenibacillus plantiphilus]|uniref:DUF2577 domain-containing protein n=1 Tax=Paenibacillus plantiphilus TaxID=2905650 RepID=A0ABM9CFF2_9BACL|nr:DUF2577 domain-containing protein [Paenibacillus plantiphilus]CAH1212308.1 hypothetical protein PAECIP111893_03518 [Paenibacillus plantiphilus]
MSIVDQIRKISNTTHIVSDPVVVMQGIVISIHPLEVNVEQRLSLKEVFLVVPERLTEYKVTLSSGEELVIREGLGVGDKVLLMRVQGGQQFIVLDRVVG